ncbi:fimbrial protein [Providencia zhijiangensis]
MINNYLLKIILVLGSFFLYSTPVKAACIQNPNFMNLMFNMPSRVYNIPYDDTTTRDLETIVIPYGTGALDTNSPNGRDCGVTDLHGRFINGWVPDANFIAPTNIPGISVSIRTGSTLWFNSYVPGRSIPNWNITETNWRIIIRKTGRVTQPGTLTPGRTAQLFQTNTKPVKSTWYLTTLNIPNNAITINTVSCSLKNPTYIIDMGNWYDSQFQNIGDTSTSVNIPITLSCKAGANIKATITSSAGYEDTQTGKLKLAGSDQASGIAIQLLDRNNNPIKLNTKNNLQDNVPAGDYIFNWKARYIKTATPVVAGTANSNAVVNIRYE